MNTQPPDRRDVSRPALWFGLLGGAVAWLAHLLLAYAISEFGCAGGTGRMTILGITGVAWSLIAVSGVTVFISAAATWVAYRSHRRLGTRERDAAEAHGPEIDIARAGLIMSGLFVFIIAVESVPIFFFLRDC